MKLPERNDNEGAAIRDMHKQLINQKAGYNNKDVPAYSDLNKQNWTSSIRTPVEESIKNDWKARVGVDTQAGLTKTKEEKPKLPAEATEKTKPKPMSIVWVGKFSWQK